MLEIDNILIPYNIVGTPKLKRLTALTQRAKIIVLFRRG